jgi:D-3-phosphoglycerate dehydrogenase
MKIAILDDYQNLSSLFPCINKLREKAEVIVFHDVIKSEEDLAARLKDFDILLPIRQRTWFPAGLLRRLPKLKLISQTGSGVNHIDLAAADSLGILVSYTESNPWGPIELTFGLILAFTHNIAIENQAIRSGK